ncbi:MAG TPA: hypothetical protein VMW83_13790 [Spirochaetia bacterium]|nr:hypothetical protein [Spirochaetia bacterium]
MNNKNYWDMTKEEKEAMLAAAAKEEIAKHHAAGRATVHGDDKGVFLIHPDGTKEYVKMYNLPEIDRQNHINRYEEMDRI